MFYVAVSKGPDMFAKFSRVSEAVWFLYLVLKSFSVSPMHVVFLSFRVTVAW